MTSILCRVELPVDTNLSKDMVVNTFAFDNGDEGGDLTQAAADLLANRIRGFYNDTPTGGLAAIRDVMSPQMTDSVNVPVKFYDVTGNLGGAAPAGSPLFVSGFGLGNNRTGGVVGLPGEVAACLTLEATGRAEAAVEAPDGGDLGGEVDRPKERRTGRIYLGHLASNALSVVGGAVRLGANVRDTATLAAIDLAGGVFDDTGYDWCVWSRKDADMRRIVSTSMDDAFDVMNSRGVAATTRTRRNV